MTISFIVYRFLLRHNLYANRYELWMIMLRFVFLQMITLMPDQHFRREIEMEIRPTFTRISIARGVLCSGPTSVGPRERYVLNDGFKREKERGREREREREGSLSL